MVETFVMLQEWDADMFLADLMLGMKKIDTSATRTSIVQSVTCRTSSHLLRITLVTGVERFKY